MQINKFNRWPCIAYCLFWDSLPWLINPFWNIHPFHPPGRLNLNPIMLITMLHVVLEQLVDSNIKDLKLICVPTKYKSTLMPQSWIACTDSVMKWTKFIREKVSRRLVCAVRLPNLFNPLQNSLNFTLYSIHRILREIVSRIFANYSSSLSSL